MNEVSVSEAMAKLRARAQAEAILDLDAVGVLGHNHGRVYEQGVGWMHVDASACRGCVWVMLAELTLKMQEGKGQPIRTTYEVPQPGGEVKGVEGWFIPDDSE